MPDHFVATAVAIPIPLVFIAYTIQRMKVETQAFVAQKGQVKPRVSLSKKNGPLVAPNSERQGRRECGGAGRLDTFIIFAKVESFCKKRQ